MKKIALFLIMINIKLCLFAFCKDSVRVNLFNETQELYHFCIANNSEDTIYMFDSYLEKCADGYIYFSKYVHRYDKSSNLYKLSLLPILPSIGVHGCLNDVFLTTTKKVVGVRQIGFSFTSIPPGDSLIVLLQKDAFRCLSYIKEIFPERLSCYHHLLPKLKDIRLKTVPKEIVLEFAIYTKVDMLQKTCHDLWTVENVSLEDYDKCATNFNCFSVKVCP